MNARQDGETQEQYRLRQRLEKQAVKDHLRGVQVFNSRPRGLHRSGETYRAPR